MTGSSSGICRQVKELGEIPKAEKGTAGKMTLLEEGYKKLAANKKLAEADRLERLAPSDRY